MMQKDILSGVLGACIGDILGVPVEFMSRKELVQNPVTDLREYGTHQQPKGTWSDDTSMTLCTLDSLINGLDYDDLMQKFSLWLYQAEYTPHGEAFDIGHTTSNAIKRFTKGEIALKCGGDSESDNGNGSLMRILPISFYLFRKYGVEIANEEVMTIIHRVSSLTHRHKRSHIACGIYIHIAIFIMSKRHLHLAIHKGLQQAFQYYQQIPHYAAELHHFNRLRDRHFANVPSEKINSSGYVVDTLEAAIWCLWNTKNYKECVLKAVNLGEDTDTVAAVAGGLAGLYYGTDGIPDEWSNAVVNKEYIEVLCEKFYTSLSNSYEVVFSYIPYLEESSSQSVCKWVGSKKQNDGSMTMGYPIYEERLKNFINEVYKTDLIDRDYMIIIDKYVQFMVDANNLEIIIDSANLELIKAIFTFYVLQERFWDGYWAMAVDEKVFLKLLERLKKLENLK